MSTPTATPHRLRKRRKLGPWIEARRARLSWKLDRMAASNPGNVRDMSPESLARCRARLAQLCNLDRPFTLPHP